jgi:alpha-glucuronidase
MKISRSFSIILFSLLFVFQLLFQTRAETGYEAWLRYAEINDAAVKKNYDEALPAVVVVSNNSEVELAAQSELLRGLRGMLGRTLRTETTPPDENAILLGTFDEIKKVVPTFNAPADLPEDGF